MNYPIYVISKGRHDCQMTSRALSRMGKKHYVVVEPQEKEKYLSLLPDFGEILVTPFSNLGQGSIPVRNFVWDHSFGRKDKRHWIIDDNISNFYKIENGKRVIAQDKEIFNKAESFVDKFSNVPMSGFNYTTFAIPSSKIKPFTLNTRIYSCILIENKHSMRWRGKYNEDTDLSLRFLKKGLCTILFNAFLIDKTQTLKMKGGNEGIYKETNNRIEFAESLRAQHPDVVKVVNKWGRYHHQVNYKPFKNNTLRKINKVYANKPALEFLR